MRPRLILATFAALIAGMLVGGASPAGAVPTPTDFWLNKHFMNMAHQGGELEAPGNTLYAFKTAIRDRGADTLEMDGYLTQDGVFVITHDLSTNPTSNSSVADPGAQINTRTLAQLKQLDFGWKFTPGKGHYGYSEDDPHPYRGIATGDKPAPEGYTAGDFKIATFREVLEAFPDTPLNVDMKAPGGDPGMSVTAATEVAKILADYPERSEDVIVASFYQPALVAFHEELPSWKALSVGEGGPGNGGLFDYVLQGTPMQPNPVALQPPDWIYLGDWMEPINLIKRQPDHTDYAIHVWPNDHDPEQDTPPYYRRQIELGVDGIFTQVPAKLHEFLCEEGIPRPDGSPRCAAQECPEGMVGIQPECTHVDWGSVLKGLKMKPKKRKIRAGKKVRIKVVGKVIPGPMRRKFRVRLRSSNRQVKVPKSVVIRIKGKTAQATFTVRATRKARGKAKITARSAKFKAVTRLKVIQPKKKTRR